VGGYERGERVISLGRFCQLAGLYGFPPERLLSDALKSMISDDDSPRLAIDLERFSTLGGNREEAERVSDFIHRVRETRGDHAGDVITLRAGDLEAMALASGRDSRALRDMLGPALRVGRPPALE
jgi:hypothetical protein